MLYGIKVSIPYAVGGAIEMRFPVNVHSVYKSYFYLPWNSLDSRLFSKF
jgi:hypothetical protein